MTGCKLPGQAQCLDFGDTKTLPFKVLLYYSKQNLNVAIMKILNCNMPHVEILLVPDHDMHFRQENIYSIFFFCIIRKRTPNNLFPY